MSLNYILLWIIGYPLELIASAMVIGYWEGDGNGAVAFQNRAGWVALFYVTFTLVGFFGARAYGEVEAILSIVKIVAVIGFCIFGIWAACDATPPAAQIIGSSIEPLFDGRTGNAFYAAGGSFGSQLYHIPGGFSLSYNAVKGICSVFVTSAFAFSGTELTALASAETAQPQHVLPRAIRQVFWRVILFFVVSLIICFCLVRSDDCNLTNTCPHQDGSAAGNDGRSALFVLAIKNAGISGLPSVMNVVILLASPSVANSSIYACSRTIAAMGNEGQLPKVCGYIDRAGRPLVALAITCTVGLISFASASPNYSQGFDWLVAISGQSTLFVWGSAGINLIRMRLAMNKQGILLDRLAYQSPLGLFGGYLSVIAILAVLGVQFWVGLFPLGEHKPDAKSFFETYLATIIVIFCFFSINFGLKNGFHLNW